MLQFLVIVNEVPSSVILFAMIVEIYSSEASVLRRAIRHNIPEDGIPLSHHREILKSYK
jgi:hypothetical protein